MAQAITAQNFDEIIATSDKPVFVDFWGSYCRPCLALAPTIDEIAEEMKDRLAVYKCNVQEEPELATRFQIMSIPTMLIFKDGKAVHGMVGAMDKADLVAEIEAHI